MITPSFSLTATERVLPKMALDFTTAILDPRVTFTRSANTATVINSSGYVALINADLPRFDFDPTTLLCKGLLIEEASTNLLSYSENQSNAAWNIVTNIGVAASATIDPANGTSAFTLTANANNAVLGRIYSGTIGIPYTYSIWIKRKTGSGQIFMYCGDNIAQNVTSKVTSNWSRIPVSNTPTSTNVRCYIQVSVLGDEIEIYGAQLEQKAFPTSYIPTEATTVTRNADVATMTGTNFSDWYNASEGAFMTQFVRPWTPNTAGVFPRVFSAGVSGSNAQAIEVNGVNGAEQMTVIDTTVQATLNMTAAVANQITRITAAYKTDNFAAAKNGAAPLFDTAGSVPTVSQLRIGDRQDGIRTLNGTVQKILYWPYRLTNAEVQAFSK